MAVEIGDSRRQREALDALVNEIATGSEESLNVALKTVLEGGSMQGLRAALVDAKKKKEADIDRICFRHYNEFLESVRDIVNMRGSANELKDVLEVVNDELQTTGQDMIGILTDREQLQVERDGVQNVLEAASKCRYLSGLMLQARKQVSSENHYEALRTIEIVKNEQKNVKVKSMLNLLAAWLPSIMNEVFGSAKAEADTFLSKVRGDCYFYGTTILRLKAKAIREDAAKLRNAKMQEAKKLSLSLQYLLKNSALLSIDSFMLDYDYAEIIPVNFTEEDVQQESVDKLDDFFNKMGPLHRALHTFTVLDELASYYSHYHTMRLLEVDKLFDKATKATCKHGLDHVIPALVANIAGFFALECFFQKATDAASGPFSVAEISELWLYTCARLDSLCVSGGGSLQTSSQLLLIKEELLLLACTVVDDLFGLSPDGLYETMQSLWAPFEQLQVAEVYILCEAALSTGDAAAFQPLIVTSEKQMDALVHAYGLENVRSEGGTLVLGGPTDDLSTSLAMMKLNKLESGMRRRKSVVTSKTPPLDASTAPNSNNNTTVCKTMVFSSVVPQILKQLNFFLLKFLLFISLNARLGDRGEDLCRAVYRAYEVIGAKLNNEAQESGLDASLTRVSQISIDATVLSLYLSSGALWNILETTLHHFRWNESVRLHLPFAVTQAAGSMDRVAKQVYTFVCELLSNKIEDLMEYFSSIDFRPNNAPDKPHREVEEIILFLQNTFLALSALPREGKEALYLTACASVADGMMDRLVREVGAGGGADTNVLCLLAFKLDVKRLQAFADDCAVAVGLQNEALQQRLRGSFSSLDQLLGAALLPAPDLLALIDATGAAPQDRSKDRALSLARAYPQLNPAHLAALLNKLTPLGSSKTVTVGKHAYPNYDKAAIRTILKALKANKLLV